MAGEEKELTNQQLINIILASGDGDDELIKRAMLKGLVEAGLEESAAKAALDDSENFQRLKGELQKEARQMFTQNVDGLKALDANKDRTIDSTEINAAVERGDELPKSLQETLKMDCQAPYFAREHLQANPDTHANVSSIIYKKELLSWLAGMSNVIGDEALMGVVETPNRVDLRDVDSCKVLSPSVPDASSKGPRER